MSALAVLLGAAFGTALLWAAWTRRWLRASGVAAGALVGLGLGIGLGWRGLSPLVFFFVTSSILTRGRARARAREGGASAGAGRTAGQVLANGGIAAFAALAAGLEAWPSAAGALAASGSLAAATADTWSSEVGEWVRGRTRLVTTWRAVPPGTDGAVSWPGTAAGALGALLAGGVAAAAFGRPGWLLPLAAAGVGGMAVDSLLGATVEGRRRWLGNDAVNWAGTCAGALLALILA